MIHRGQPKSGPYLLSVLASHDDPGVWGEELPQQREDDKQNITGAIHSGVRKSGPYLLKAADYVPFSTPPGDPVKMKGTPRAPYAPSQEPEIDPSGRLNVMPYNYEDAVNNIVGHYNGADEGEHREGRLWYKTAHDLFHRTAKQLGISPERAVAMASAFSPNTDWGDNIKHAQNFMLNYRPTLEDGSPNPDFSPHDWKMAHLDPKAVDAFRQQAGRDPTESDEDLHALADLHGNSFKRGPKKDLTNDLSNPDARADWMANIQHHGMDKVMEDHAAQALAKYKKVGHPPYVPEDAMRAAGINTLGGNIDKAKALHAAPEDLAQYFRVLGGPKISHFTDNILDDTPINEDGYYEHPEGDWTKHADLGGTIDSHHLRASSMPHGGWVDTDYHGGTKGIVNPKTGKPYELDPTNSSTYDVFNRGLLEATRRINAAQRDATKHVTPKQVQAVVWLKHKNDNDFFRRQRNPQTGQMLENQAQAPGLQRPAGWRAASKDYKTRDQDQIVAAMTPEEFFGMPPLWRKMFMSNQSPEWTDLLHDYVQTLPSSNSDLEQHEDQRLGPHPQHEAAIQNNWFTTAPAVPSRRTIAPRGNPYRTPDHLYRPHQMHVDAPGTSHNAARWFLAQDPDHTDDQDVGKKKVSPPTSQGGGVSTPAMAVDTPYVAAPPLNVAPMSSGGHGGGGGGGYGGGGGNAGADLGHGPGVTVPLNGGGLSSAQMWLNTNNGNAYDYGGHGNGAYDCSGGQSELYNYLTGKQPGTRNFDTTVFGNPQKAQALGFQPGYDPNSIYNIGVNTAPGTSGHMAGEFNGKNFEVGGAADKFQYGGGAKGPLDSQFSTHYHLPNSMIVGYQPPSATPTAPSTTPTAAPKAASKWYKQAAPLGAGGMASGGISGGYNDATPFAGTFDNQYTSGTGGAWAMAHPPGLSSPGGGAVPGGGGGGGGSAGGGGGPAGSAGLHYSPGQGGGGGNAADYINQRGQQLGLNPTEIAMAQAVRVHEGLGPTGTPSMGFGPEAKGAGFNFDSNPNGAVDQYYKQYMDRMPSNLNRNDPNALSSYIWHDVHHAQDPNYGPELLNSYVPPSNSSSSGPPGSS